GAGGQGQGEAEEEGESHGGHSPGGLGLLLPYRPARGNQWPASCPIYHGGLGLVRGEPVRYNTHREPRQEACSMAAALSETRILAIGAVALGCNVACLLVLLARPSGGFRHSSCVGWRAAVGWPSERRSAASGWSSPGRWRPAGERWRATH